MMFLLVHILTHVHWLLRPSKVRLDLERLFADNNVTVAFSAHEHEYERTCPLLDMACDGDVGANDTMFTSHPRHPIHVVTGAGGSHEGIDTFQRNHGNWSAVRDSNWGFGKLYANRTHFAFTQLHIPNQANSGSLTTADRFTIAREDIY